MMTRNRLAIAFVPIIVLFLSGCVSQGLGGGIVGLGETKVVTKVIDGDTVIVEGGDSVRLLGIDTDERGYPCYDEARQRLEELILNDKVTLQPEGEDKDQYGRYLRYVFINDDNINLLMVKEGLAIARLDSDNVKYRNELVAAEKDAMKNGIGCKWNANSQAAVASAIQTGADNQNLKWSTLSGQAIPACEASNYLNQEKIVEGLVIDGAKSQTDTIFLNFGKLYPNHCFTAVIFASDLSKFPNNPHLYYEGKTVRVFGKIKAYNGKPEIILEDVSQIQVGG